MNERDMDRAVESLRESYNAPPEPPTDLMWARIAAEKKKPSRPSMRWLGWAAAAAAVLLLGIGIGRMSSPPAPTPPQVVSPQTDLLPEVPSLLAIAAREYLERSETRLAQFQSEVASGESVGEWATDLLTQTRLLLDTPLTDDTELHMLLLDLEFVFAQISEVSQHNDVEGQNHVAQRLTEEDLMLRVRSSNPAGVARTDAQEGKL